MACQICGKKFGIFGGDFSFKCPVCKKEICKECANKYSNAKTFGGLFGDKHLEITCPNCHSTIRVR